MEKERLIFDEIMDAKRYSSSRMALAGLLGRVPVFDLACVGISIRGLGAITFEALAYLASADVVFSYPVTKSHYELLKLINENVVNVHETFYVRGAVFESAYTEIIEDVMRVLRSGKKVAYATQGSPAFHCGTCTSLHRRAIGEGFSSILLGGVSSFELLTAELAAEYDLINVQITSVLDLMDNAVVINPKTPCLLFDLGRYVLPGVRQPTTAMDRPKLVAVARMLFASYPPEHEIVLMYIRPKGPCLRQKIKLLDLEDGVMQLGVIPTLFLPSTVGIDTTGGFQNRNEGRSG